MLFDLTQIAFRPLTGSKPSSDQHFEFFHVRKLSGWLTERLSECYQNFDIFTWHKISRSLAFDVFLPLC
jgi:hypothetical protein